MTRRTNVRRSSLLALLCLLLAATSLTITVGCGPNCNPKGKWKLTWQRTDGQCPIPKVNEIDFGDGITNETTSDGCNIRFDRTACKASLDCQTQEDGIEIAFKGDMAFSGNKGNGSIKADITNADGDTIQCTFSLTATP